MVETGCTSRGIVLLFARGRLCLVVGRGVEVRREEGGRVGRALKGHTAVKNLIHTQGFILTQGQESV